MAKIFLYQQDENVCCKCFLIFTNLLFHTQYNLQHVEISDWLSVFHIYCLTICIILLLDCLVQCDFILFSFNLTSTTQIYLLKQVAELSYTTHPMIKIQRCSEGTSSVAFRVLTINFQTYFISFLIFNSLTSDRNLFILNYLTSNFYFLKIYLSQAEDIDFLWTRVLIFGF